MQGHTGKRSSLRARSAGNATSEPLIPTSMVRQQIANTGIIPSMASADDGYSSQLGRDEVLGLGLKVVSLGGAKGKKITEAQQWNSPPYRQARAERSAIVTARISFPSALRSVALWLQNLSKKCPALSDRSLQWSRLS